MSSIITAIAIGALAFYIMSFVFRRITKRRYGSMSQDDEKTDQHSDSGQVEHDNKLKQ